MKKTIVLATAVAAVLTSGVASADLSANAAITSNYIWRGVTQTTDQAAGQGGLDYSHESGLYAGTWLSNVNFTDSDGNDSGEGYEMDLYAGFSGEVSDIGYDLGVISYQYPITPQANFTEVYVSGSASIVTVGVSYTVDAASGNAGNQFDTGDIYVNGSLDFSAGKSDISIYGGSYSFDNDSSSNDLDYIHYGASIAKDGFTFAVDKNDISSNAASADDNVRFTVSYSMDFEL
ncbi:MAG TPA: hypothetical protein ENJ87_02235 [Gammaproteobacteria bacterium]|nr:hypothetical protein [Gammaproteobacteria bacterium]